MIENRQLAKIAILWVLLVGPGCDRPQRHQGAFQGIVEFDERDLGFELGGRLTSVKVDEGSPVSKGLEIASLDAEVQHKLVEARSSEAAAAHAQVVVVEAGPRNEEVRAMRARLDAAKAAEAQLASVLVRHRALAGGPGATPVALVEELEAKHLASIAESRAIEQQLHALRSGARAQEIAAAEAKAAAADAAVAVERERLTRFVLESPVDGVVIDVLSEPGEVVSPGAPVVTVADTKHPYVDVFVPEAQMVGLAVNQAAEVYLDGVDTPYGGRVEHLWQRTEFTPRFLFSDGERPNLVIRVRVRIDDPGETLNAGLPAFVYVTAAKPAQ